MSDKSYNNQPILRGVSIIWPMRQGNEVFTQKTLKNMVGQKVYILWDQYLVVDYSMIDRDNALIRLDVVDE